MNNKKSLRLEEKWNMFRGKNKDKYVDTVIDIVLVFFLLLIFAILHLFLVLLSLIWACIFLLPQLNFVSQEHELNNISVS